MMELRCIEPNMLKIGNELTRLSRFLGLLNHRISTQLSICGIFSRQRSVTEGPCQKVKGPGSSYIRGMGSIGSFTAEKICFECASLFEIGHISKRISDEILKIKIKNDYFMI